MKNKVLLISLALVLVISTVFIGCTQQVTPPPTEVEITLGAPLSLGYPDGICARDNLQLAVDAINDAGGFTVGETTYKFKLVSEDTRDLEPGASAVQALACVDDLILNKGVNFIVGGPIRSDIALAAMDEIYNLATQGHPTVAVWSAGFLSPAFGPKVTGNKTKYQYCFRTQGAEAPLVLEGVEMLKSLATAKGWTNPKAYIMVQNVAHAVGAGGTFNSSLSAAGWTIAGFDIFPTGTTDFTTQLLNAGASGAQVLVVWFDMPESAYLINKWYDLQLPMLPFGFVVPCLDARAWITFKTGDTSKCAYTVHVYPQAGITPINSVAQAYITLYKSKNSGLEPGLTWVAPTSYEVPYILKDAILRAGSLDASAMITALEATNMQGVYGKVSFGADHDIVHTTDPSTGEISTWIQWVNGARVPLYPAAVKTADIVLPPWMS